jgi:hypothetical protein
LYTTKYLLSSWKLNDNLGELASYEMLGKYYYYNGDIKKSLFFHNKMMMGNVESNTSVIRRLGISKLNDGSLGKYKKHR